MLKTARDWWMAFVHVIGKVQTTILLSIVYHVALGPIALARLLTGGDLLELKGKADVSYAKQSPRISSTLEDAEKQF